MAAEEEWRFGPFRLEEGSARLWHGPHVVHLRPKSFAVLHYLLTHAGRLVTKDDILQAVWPEVVVSETMLTICVGELRRALGETRQAPTYIETVSRRGYRFLAPVTRGGAGQTAPPPAAAPEVVQPGARAPILVGRDLQLGQLHDFLERARRGERQMVFVTGEPGIGKTTLVDALCAHADTEAPLWIVRGHCLAHHGAGEVYLPVFEGLAQLCHGPEGAQIVARLAQLAPTWLLQMSNLLSTADLEALQRRTLGTTPARMLRELAEALEVLTAERLLVLVLEDLHWSDAATVDLLAYVARRRQPARLLLLGTYRPADVIARNHPLRPVAHDLTLHGQSQELALALLTEAEVAHYLAVRFAGHAIPPDLIHLLHQRTDGNPLFLVTMVHYLERQGWIAAGVGRVMVQHGIAAMTAEVPETLRQLIEQQLEQLSAATQRLLEAASVAGVEWSAAAVAAAIDAEQLWVERECTGLARRGQFVQARGVEEWPDGTLAERWAFHHALYQQVLYDRVPVGRRVQLHRTLGEREAAAYGVRAVEKAAELAIHFDRGRDAVQAVWYLRQAAANALGRYAYTEAMAHCTRGLELLPTLPDTPERAQQELALLLALGSALMTTRGQAAPEVEPIYARARALCQQVGDTPEIFPALRGLWRFSLGHGALPTARQLGAEIHRSARRLADPMHLLEAHDALGITLFFLGEYAAAQEHFEHAISHIDLEAQRALALRHGETPGVRCLAMAANTLWCLGYPAQAVQRSQEALAMAQALAHPHSVADALYFAAFLHYRRGEAPVVQAQAEALLTLATEQQLPLFVGFGTAWRGWALAVQGQDEVGLRQLRQGMAAVLATGHLLAQPFCLVLLAEAAGYANHIAEGQSLLDEALVAMEVSGRGDLRAEAYRLQGELLLRQAIPEEARAEACFQQALAIARRQQAKAWELRATLSLAQLWQRQDRRAAAQQMLAEVYGWFTEGFDTTDLQEAQALLAALQ